MDVGEHVVALIDMDCFYVQVEQRLQPHLWGTPVAVIQYSNVKGGGILAVSYEARKFGVKRYGMRGDEAKRVCPEITLCEVPKCEHSEKADLARYREASEDVFRSLNSFDSRVVVERASIDEAFIDLTDLVNFVIAAEEPALKYSASLDAFPTTHIAGERDVCEEGASSWEYNREEVLREWMNDACKQQGKLLKLAVAAEIVEQMRARLKEQTQFRCSAGIGFNKMIAKLVCSRHKPGQQTIVCDSAIPAVFRRTPITSVRYLGGKLGRALGDVFGIKTMAELAAIPFDALKAKFPTQAQWIHNIANGVDEELVRVRDKQSSIAVSKLFLGPASLTTVSDVKSWLDGLAKELAKRLCEDQIKNGRTACTLHVGCSTDAMLGKSCPLVSYAPDALYNSSWSILRHFNKATGSSDAWKPPVVCITLTASRFRDGIDVSSRRITEWACGSASVFVPQSTLCSAASTSSANETLCLEEAATTRATIADPSSEGNAKILVEAEEQQGNSSVADKEARGDADTAEQFLPSSMDKIPEDLLKDIPADIRTELAYYYRQKALRSGSASLPRLGSPGRSKPAAKRRSSKAPHKDSQPESKKKISDFFKKPM